MSSYPMQVLFLSPPDKDLSTNPPIGESLQAYSYSLSIIFCDFTSISESVRFVLNLHAKQKDSKGVIVSIRISSYITKAPKLPN